MYIISIYIYLLQIKCADEISVTNVLMNQDSCVSEFMKRS